jgi:hypothetical protein
LKIINWKSNEFEPQRRRQGFFPQIARITQISKNYFLRKSAASVDKKGFLCVSLPLR